MYAREKKGLKTKVIKENEGKFRKKYVDLLSANGTMFFRNFGNVNLSNVCKEQQEGKKKR